MLRKLAQQGSSLAGEMRKFSSYGRVCAMKGLLQALPMDVLAAKLCIDSHSMPDGTLQHQTLPSSQSETAAKPQHYADKRSDGSLLEHTAASSKGETAIDTSRGTAAVKQLQKGGVAGSISIPMLNSTAVVEQHQNGDVPGKGGGSTPDSGRDNHARVDPRASDSTRPWLLLSDGALPACCEAVRSSTDAHHKFHAVSALALCLERIKQCLQVRSGFPSNWWIHSV